MIYCLEAPWLEEGVSGVEHTVEYIGILFKSPWEYVSCKNKKSFLKALANTPEEVGVLYISAHGEPGRVKFGEELVSLEEISSTMGKNYKGWHIHFGTCLTLKVSQKRLDNFIGATGVRVLSGYTKAIDWVEGHAMDEMIVSTSVWNRFQLENYVTSYYSGLAELLGFKYDIR